jgi:GntR family transcriptional regulator
MISSASAPDSVPYVLPAADRSGDAWAAEARALGHVGTQRLVEVAHVAASALVAEALKLPIGAVVVVRRRLILLDDQPVELADSYYPAHVAIGTPLAEAAKIQGGAPTLLAALGYQAAECFEQLTVRPASAPEAASLAVAPGAAVIQLARTTFDAAGTAFEVAVMTMRPEGRTFRYRFPIDNSGGENAIQR